MAYLRTVYAMRPDASGVLRLVEIPRSDPAFSVERPGREHGVFAPRVMGSTFGATVSIKRGKKAKPVKKVFRAS